MIGEEQPGEKALPVGQAASAAAGQAASGAVPWQQMAAVLEAAAREVYIAMRTLAASLPVTPQPGIPGAVPGKIRQAANATGTAWQCLASGYPAGTAAATPGLATALREAVRRAVAAWSPPVATAPGLDEITAMAMETVHAMAAAAGYLAWESTGARACWLRNAQYSLQSAGEHLREAVSCCSRAASGPRRDAALIARPGDAGHGTGKGGTPAYRHQRTAPEQAERPPYQFPRPWRSDTGPARHRGNRMAYRIRELLAPGVWPGKRSGKRRSAGIPVIPGDEHAMRENGNRALRKPGPRDSAGQHKIPVTIFPDAVITLAAGAVAAVTLLAGCGGSASVPVPARSPSLRVPTAAPSASGSAPARTQVIAAYTAFFPASEAAERAAPSRARAILAPHAASPYLDRVLAQMAGYRARGETTRGYVIPHVTKVTVSGRLAEVHDCQDASHAALASASTGEVIQGTTGSARTYLIASLALGRDGRWRITSLAHVAVPCSPAPSPPS
jgi:hypothetical protein